MNIPSASSFQRFNETDAPLLKKINKSTAVISKAKNILEKAWFSLTSLKLTLDKVLRCWYNKTDNPKRVERDDGKEWKTRRKLRHWKMTTRKNSMSNSKNNRNNWFLDADAWQRFFSWPSLFCLFWHPIDERLSSLRCFQTRTSRCNCWIRSSW